MGEGKNIKICIVLISLAKGGAERSTALLSKMLAAQGFDVHIALLTNAIDYEYAGTLFNLGEDKEKGNSVLDRWGRSRKLRNYLISNKFNFIIDSRNRKFALKERIYHHYIYKGLKVIYMVRSFNLNQYLPVNSMIAKKMVDSSFKFVGVSKKISEAINSTYHTNKAITIYNPIEEFPKVAISEVSEKYIIFLGRLRDDVKNFKLLLESYKNSQLASQGVTLKIFGDGPDKELVEDYISHLKLEDHVRMHGFKSEIYPELAKAKFLVLTSRYEGFPRVLIESLAMGTPVLSVNCESGPSEIITHESNGLLVENYNAAALSEGMDRLILDEELYLRCKGNAISSIAHLKMDIIGQQWSQLLKNEYREL